MLVPDATVPVCGWERERCSERLTVMALSELTFGCTLVERYRGNRWQSSPGWGSAITELFGCEGICRKRACKTHVALTVSSSSRWTFLWTSEISISTTPVGQNNRGRGSVFKLMSDEMWERKKANKFSSGDMSCIYTLYMKECVAVKRCTSFVALQKPWQQKSDVTD